MNQERLVTLQIDGKEVKVPEGTTTIEAAAQADIEIPHLCWLEGLPGIGACRLCLVEVEGARDLVASCARKVEEGMVVRTKTDKVIEARRFILELIWSIHPGDCTICEKSGSCELQEYTYKLGLDKRRFPLAVKGEYPIDTRSPLIEMDLNLCILCGRCIRICQLQGHYVLDFASRGMVTKVATAFDRPLQESGCTFCGSCISVCPVGCLIEKDRRFRGREWEFRATETVCPYCGCGCKMLLDTVKEQIVRARPQERNGYLCALGKFGWDYVLSTERLKRPLIKRNGALEESSWDEALEYIAQKLKEIKESRGPEALGGLVSAHYPSETIYLFGKFMRACLGTNNIDSSVRLLSFPALAGFIEAFGTIDGVATLSEIEEADTLLLLGADVTVSYPAVGVKVKEALRNGATLITIDPRKTEIAEISRLHLRPSPGNEAALLDGLIKVLIDEELYDKEFVKRSCTGFKELSEKAGVPKEELLEAARLYAKGKKAIIIFPAEGSDPRIVSRIANLLMLTGRVEGGAFPCLLKSNLWGAAEVGALAEFLPGYRRVEDEASRKELEESWLVSLPERPGLSAIEMIQSESISGMYILGENPAASFPDKTKTVEKLSSLDLLVVQDIFLTETAKLADVVLPGASFAEISGTFTNAEGKAQRLNRAITPMVRPDWQIIAELSSMMGYPMEYRSEEELAEEMRGLISGEDRSKRKYRFKAAGAEPGSAEEPDGDYPYRLLTGATLSGFGDGSWTRRSKIATLGGDGESYIEMSPQDAESLWVSEGSLVTVSSRRGSITAKVKLQESLPPGLVFMPTHAEGCNLLTSAELDPVTKGPKFRLTAVKVIPKER